jgi:hypothetical protein
MFLCLLGLFVKLRLILTGYKWGVFLREEDGREKGTDLFVWLVPS